MPEDMSDRMPEDMPDRMPNRIPDRMPDHMPEDMPDHMPEDMPDRMPDNMPEDMPDRMPEDLPVRKCINVMVGITRSKVFFCCIFSGLPKQTSPSDSTRHFMRTPRVTLNKPQRYISRFHTMAVELHRLYALCLDCHRIG